MKRTLALGLSAALASTSYLAFADVGPATVASTGTALGTGGTGAPGNFGGAGGGGHLNITDSGCGCRTGASSVQDSAALLLGLGLLLAIPLARRRRAAR